MKIWGKKSPEGVWPELLLWWSRMDVNRFEDIPKGVFLIFHLCIAFPIQLMLTFVLPGRKTKGWW